MLKLYNVLFVVTIFIFINGCTSEFEEINTNDNDPTDSNPSTLLPSVIFEPINAHMLLQTWLTDQVMHYYVRRNDNQLDAYDFAAGQNYFNDIWQRNYAAIWNANDMITTAEEEGFSAYQAAGKIMKAY